MVHAYKTLRLILGDQLNASHSWYTCKNDDTLYVIAELHQETSYVKHHVQKVCAFFAAMHAFSQALSKAGHHVTYLTLDETQHFSHLPSLLADLIEKHHITLFEYQLPDEYRLRRQLSDFQNEIKVASNVYETEHFYLSDNEISRYFTRGKKHRLEAFYRKMRTRFNVLMEEGQPIGGEWNYDSNNRNKLKQKDLSIIPEPLMFDNDVSEIEKRLKRHKVDTFGAYHAQLLWPVNRQQARELVRAFCETQLSKFGFFQDAMTCKADDLYTKKQWSLYHSRLSFALNSKIISPAYVVDTVISYYHNHANEIDIAQIEGFVRQIIGWREFVRGIYWVNMPEYAQLNELQAKRNLPHWFWSGETKMNCQNETIRKKTHLQTKYFLSKFL